MNSLDKLITKAALELPREPLLVSPVMAKIKARQARRAKLINRSLLGSFIIGMLAIGAALLRGNAGKVLTLAVHKYSSVPQHPGLYVRALVETLPWPAIATVAGIALLARIMQRNKLVLAKHASAAMAVSAGALLITATASAATITTVGDQAGPVQQQLERTINGLGKQEVTVDGHTYEISGGAINDRQIKAYVEQRAIWEIRKTLDLPADKNDGGTLAYGARVISITPTELEMTDVDPNSFKVVGTDPSNPPKLKITSQTVFIKGGKKVDKLELLPGDYIQVAAAKDFVTAGYIALMSYDPSDYTWVSGITPTSKHGKNGKCYNNETEKCPNLPAVFDLLGLGDYQTVPTDGVIREVFGKLESVDGDVAKIKTSSGTVWSFNIGYNEITHTNESGYYCPSCPNGADLNMQINRGDYLRVEFWQHKTDLNKREVFDQGFKGTKDEARKLLAEGKLNLNPEIYIRSVQIALKQPWYTGQQPVKFNP